MTAICQNMKKIAYLLDRKPRKDNIGVYVNAVIHIFAIVWLNISNKGEYAIKLA